MYNYKSKAKHMRIPAITSISVLLVDKSSLQSSSNSPQQLIPALVQHHRVVQNDALSLNSVRRASTKTALARSVQKKICDR